jgi:ubiquinone biosynthesis accessory factor UbiK
MVNSQVINDLSNKIKEIIKNSPVQEIENNINALIRGALTKMELVTREEFDVQIKALQNTRELLVNMEVKLTELEAQIKQKQ